MDSPGGLDQLDPKLLLAHLCSSVGHHIINAFSTIVSQSEILRSLRSDPPKLLVEAEGRIETVIKTALEASITTRQLIELAQRMTSIEADSAGSQSEEIDLPRLVAEEVSHLAGTLGDRIRIEQSLSSVPRIRGMRSSLSAMIQLLIANAVEAIGDRPGTVRIATFVDPRQWVVLEVRDDGVGMTSAVMERAMEPFFTTKEGHMGLGLTIARGIWRRHRGTLAIESQPGHGTVIRLSIASAAGDSERSLES
jgi:two-component system NtrC family sensor kinase